MKAHTPNGSRVIIVVPRSSSNRYSLSTASAAYRCPSPDGACAALARSIGAPISEEIACATSGMRFLYARMIDSSRATRSSRVVCENVSKALRAAFTARSTSSAVPRRIVAITFSVDGSTTSCVRPDVERTQAPSM